MKNELPIGLRRGTVELISYDPAWPKLFEQERLNLEKVFAAKAKAIEHVGSTSIPGAKAKPVIDVCVAIEKLDDYKKFVPELERISYHFMPERVSAERVFMPKGPEAKRDFYLHIVEFGSPEFHNLIVFRDKLRTNTEMVKQYNELKSFLAEKYFDDREAYTSGKNEFISEALKS